MSAFSVVDAVRLLTGGGVCAVVSETVYGLAGNAYLDASVLKVFKTKGRPAHNPLIVHYPSRDAVLRDVVWTKTATLLAERFWPGPLTLVLERAPDTHLSSLVSGGVSSVAVRVPGHPVFQALLNACGFPLVGPSANRSGCLTPTKAAHVDRSLPGVPVLVGECAFGMESSVVDARDSPRLLRAGAIDVEALEATLNAPLPHEVGSKCSPGQLLAHYAPSKPIRLEATSFLPGEGVLAFGPEAPTGAYVFNLSARGCVVEAAQRLFEGLHVLDESDCAAIAVMPVPKGGVGAAIDDRLSRAAAAYSFFSRPNTK